MKNFNLSSASLVVTLADQVVFQSSGKWLYPLFELENYLQQHPFDMTQASVFDKVIGKAAALLIIRLGAGVVYGEIMSDLAVQFLRNSKTPFSFGSRVDRVDCKTEVLLADIQDYETAHTIMKNLVRC